MFYQEISEEFEGLLIFLDENMHDLCNNLKHIKYLKEFSQKAHQTGNFLIWELTSSHFMGSGCAPIHLDTIDFDSTSF